SLRRLWIRTAAIMVTTPEMPITISVTPAIARNTVIRVPSCGGGSIGTLGALKAAALLESARHRGSTTATTPAQVVKHAFSLELILIKCFLLLSDLLLKTGESFTNVSLTILKRAEPGWYILSCPL